MRIALLEMSRPIVLLSAYMHTHTDDKQNINTLYRHYSTTNQSSERSKQCIWHVADGDETIANRPYDEGDAAQHELCYGTGSGAWPYQVSPHSHSFTLFLMLSSIQCLSFKCSLVAHLHRTPP